MPEISRTTEAYEPHLAELLACPKTELLIFPFKEGEKAAYRMRDDCGEWHAGICSIS